ncbi:MAG: DUF1553 domain-containing protein [Planctomycetota bacterium]|nr:MAG: DUF1553 domain-containing protein [Planctomycetota bacterium]
MPSISVFSLVVSGLIATVPSLMFAEVNAQQQPELTQFEFFEAKIRPVLVGSCYECHSAGAKNIKGGLLLDTQAATLKGGDTGAAVVPHNIKDSLLISALRHESLEMPPSGKLSETVIADFVTWIEMGAPDPRGGEVAMDSHIQFEEARKFWAYQPLGRPESPQVKDTSWPRQEIDHFTLAEMERRGLNPVRPASKLELIRRATFDLTGLPPTPEEVSAFLKDAAPEAFAKVIDRLLLSEHYGERWGRYWLDVARYAEDQAHTFSVTPNSNGFRYRDWVVSAFNADLPYDTFVKLQIAGDIIGPDADHPYDHLVALGFFGLGAQYYKNSDAAKAAADELDDRVDTLTRGFLGLTVSCARCHDHKFDPIPTQDYYSLAGIFNSSKLHNAPLCNAEDIAAYNAGQEKIKTLEEAVKTFLADENATAAESRVGEISKYMEAVWRYRVAVTSGQSVSSAEIAKQTEVSEFLLTRWISFLDLKEQGKVHALDPWFALNPVSAEALNAVLPENVTTVTTNFQQRVQSLLNIRDGVVTSNLVEIDNNVPHKLGSPRFVTPLVTKIRPTAGIDVDISGAKQLFLVVSDGANGNGCDHADWLEPKLVGPAGEIRLTDLKWKSLDGFGGGKIDRNYEGKQIRVGGKEYANGIGVHAPSVIVYDLPEGYLQFTAVGGLDNSGADQPGCGEQASVQFSVYTETPIEGPAGVGEDLLTKVLGKDGPLAVSNDDLEKFLSGEKKVQLTRLKADFEDAKSHAPAMYPSTHSYIDGDVADMKVFVRGNPATQRELAPRRFLKILAGEAQPLFTAGSGRKELADAIASPDNPLTVRVIVNRIWQHHFGRGIVATPSNFGKQGQPPTHPALLDYLAGKFIASGWSIKSLHREIMLSATYQLSSVFNEANANLDGDNQYLWKMSRKRLDVEAWRDALLDVSGKLDRTLGGPSTDLADANNVRRTIYAKISRHDLDNLLRLFDFPDANISSEKRSETTVPQQQLFVLNSPFMVEQAKAFAARVQKESPANDEARINLAFMLAYSRPPGDDETQLGLAYLESKDEEPSQLTRWERYAQVLLSGNEFMYLD